MARERGMSYRGGGRGGSRGGNRGGSRGGGRGGGRGHGRPPDLFPMHDPSRTENRQLGSGNRGRGDLDLVAGPRLDLIARFNIRSTETPQLDYGNAGGQQDERPSANRRSPIPEDDDSYRSNHQRADTYRPRPHGPNPDRLDFRYPDYGSMDIRQPDQPRTSGFAGYVGRYNIERGPNARRGSGAFFRRGNPNVSRPFLL